MQNRAPQKSIVEFKNVSKIFGTLKANDALSFSVTRGECHALVGENGAGKSTAMKLLYGMMTPDQGEIFLNGKPLRFNSARDACKSGIGMVHQHFMLAGRYSVLDNILLGHETRENSILPRMLRKVDRAGARKKLLQITQNSELSVDLDATVEDLPVGIQQRVEILKLLFQDADILILDEPTAVLTPQEVDELFALLKKLKEGGKTILLITHKLHEVVKHSDTVTVMRAGQVVATRPTRETSAEQIAELMVGRHIELGTRYPRARGPHTPVLELRSTSLNEKGRVRIEDLSLHVGAGEILGIAGVEGNGQNELVDIINGGIRGKGLNISFLGKDISQLPVYERRTQGIAVVAPDRHRQGALLHSSLEENFILGLQRSPAFSRWGLLRRRENVRLTQNALELFDVRPAVPSAVMGDLSGGNQQKLVVARELSRSPRLIVIAHPTRGVDIGAIEFIHHKIIAARDAGAAIVLFSSELDEILALSDRIAVIFNGRFVAEWKADSVDERAIGIAMGGGK